MWGGARSISRDECRLDDACLHVTASGGGVDTTDGSYESEVTCLW